VRRRRRDDDDVARLEHAVVAVEVEAELALEHLVALGLPGVEVLPHEEPLRTEQELVLERLATGVGARAPEEDPLARDRVLEDVARARHARTIPRATPGVGETRRGSRRRAAGPRARASVAGGVGDRA
jgi:hypothetical protein